jgi:type IV pilus assembly protein PilY1
MDEDFYGNAVGSYSPASKTVVAKQALQSLVTDLQNKANVGVMTFNLPSDVSKSWYVHNAMPFASYNPNSYCANPPQACVTYCMNPNDTASQAACDAGCPPNASLGQTFTSFTSQLFTHNDGTKTNFPDLILSTTLYPPTTDTTSIRAKYCGLAYPKTQKWQYNDPLGFTTTIYYNQTDPFYDTGDDGILFGYSGGDDPVSGYSPYSPAENAANIYTYCPNKQGPSDSWVGYSGPSGTSTAGCVNYQFAPTDSDWALGFYNWGQEMPWYYVGPTWFSPSGGSSSPQGYLHVAVGDLSGATQYNNVYNILNPMLDEVNGVYTGTNYMSCNKSGSDVNTCPYIVNATNTPTAGTLNSALSYFNGQYTNAGVESASPINSLCQKNYIIFVTDGLPSTLMNGTQTLNTSQLMTEVTTQLADLRTNVSRTINGTTQIFPVLTYVLGLGLTTEAKTNLDSMAAAGGTATSTGHAYYADQPGDLTTALETIMTDLLGRVSAGSAISILSEGQAVNGANMLQGVFYPTKYFGSTTVINWPGYLYNYWYYSTTQYNNIREDTVHDYILELNEDDGISFVFDNQTGLSIERYSDPTGSGNPTTYVNTEGLDSLSPLWEAGKMLWQTPANPTTSPVSAGRTIYTPGSSSTGLVSFDTNNAALTAPASSLLGTPSTFNSCLQVSSSNSNWQTLTLDNLINYVRGVDITGCRNRTVGLCSNGTPCSTSADCSSGGCTTNVWKMGDIVYSTPKVQADYEYCSNGSSFNSQACSQNSDCTNGSFTSCQKKESVVYVGANDGMLHAFQTGTISTAGLNSSQYQVAELTGIPTSTMGSELWAFIPQNSLPYLRCLAVPPPSSCHLYYNDLSPYITTMVSNGVSKTVLIGGMRLGGGAIASGTYCFSSAGVSNGQACTQTSNCTTSPYTASCSTNYYINAPSDTCSPSQNPPTTLSSTATLCSNPATCYNPTNCTGLSSYYALDITDAENPKLLWEFSHPFLGYTYSGPAVIHKWSDPSTLTGDQYYVMFLSGPTSPTDGSSIQDVQAFVLSLNANLGINSVYYKDLGIKNGFGGRLFTNGLDVNGDGYTDFVFFGYANSPTGSTTGWQGGIGKINTNNTDTTAALNPQNWTYDVTTYGGLAEQPITAAVEAEQCFGTWYLYSGTGRYFFPLDSYTGSGSNILMGIPFTCDQYNNNCTGISSLNNSATACSNLQKGTQTNAAWEYSLDAASGSFLQERLTTDPTISPGNKIYFTTSEPTSDPCGYGGQSRVWGLNCATGGAIADTSCSGYSVTDMTGTLYLQTSTGAIYQINAATSFTDSSTGNRTTQWFVGMPPENAPPLAQSSTLIPQTGQLIQWIEK